MNNSVGFFFALFHNYPNYDNVRHHLIEVIFVRVLHCEVSSIFFVIKKYFIRIYFEII